MKLDELDDLVLKWYVKIHSQKKMYRVFFLLPSNASYLLEDVFAIIKKYYPNTDESEIKPMSIQGEKYYTIATAMEPIYPFVLNERLSRDS